jgi:hypothetical protein
MTVHGTRKAAKHCLRRLAELWGCAQFESGHSEPFLNRRRVPDVSKWAITACCPNVCVTESCNEMASLYELQLHPM